jgi:type IV pilus assembly protein PilA
VADNAAGGYAFDKGWTAPAATENLASAAVNAANGVITVTTTAKAGGGTVLFTPLAPGALVVGVIPTDRMAWDCSTGGTLAQKYRPGQCRT